MQVPFKASLWENSSCCHAGILFFHCWGDWDQINTQPHFCYSVWITEMLINGFINQILWSEIVYSFGFTRLWSKQLKQSEAAGVSYFMSKIKFPAASLCSLPVWHMAGEAIMTRTMSTFMHNAALLIVRNCKKWFLLSFKVQLFPVSLFSFFQLIKILCHILL